MSIKYLSPSGLTEVWSNIKTYIASKIPSKIITGLSIKGRTITYTNSDGTTGTLTTQDTNTTYSVATTSTNGLMSSTDKTKLDGIDVGANNYTHPSSHPASMITGLTKVATSGSYNDLTNKPTIPTVNNATLTIQKNGTTVKTFTANSSTNVTANITVPTKTSELTNNSGFLTSHNPVDSSLSSTSTNAIQNKVVNAALNNKANNSDVVHKSGAETIVGTKTFSNVIYSNKELAYKDTKYDWTNTSLNTWCDAGHVSWSDKTGNRRMHELVGTKGGVWQKACYINEQPYFSVNSNRDITYWGTTIAFHGTTTFTGNVTCNGTSYLKMTNLESNTTTPTSAQYKHISVVANDGSQVGSIQFCKRADGSFDITIYSSSGGTNEGTFRITSNNEVYPINNKTKLGISTAKWSEVWANTFKGNLVGKQINNSDSSSLLRIFGGTNASTGANLDLNGENESSLGGGFHIRARNSSGYKALTGKVDGSLTWDGKKVLTEGNGVTVDTAQTITGEKTFSKTIHVGDLTGRPGNNLWVYAGDLNATYSKVNQRINGTIAIDCVDATTKKSSTMDLKPDGTFTWNGKHIVRTVNGVGANQAGNVNLTNILGFTPVQQGGGTGQLTNKIYIGWTGSQLKCTVDKTDLGAFVFEGRAQVGTTITAYWGSSSSTGDKWATVSGLNGTKSVTSTSDTFTPVVGQIYSGNQLYNTATGNGSVGDTGAQSPTPKVVYARLDLSGAFNSSYKYLCTTAVGVKAKATVNVTGHTTSTSSGPYTTITSYTGFTKAVYGGKSTFLRVQ